MNTTKLPLVKDLFKDAIDFTKLNYKKLIKINIFYIAIFFSSLVSTVIVFLVTTIIFPNQVANFISYIWAFLVFSAMYLFIFQLNIALYKNKLRSISDELNDYYLKIKSATWTTLLYSCTIRAAFLLLIVPGVILSVPFKFLPFVFFEKNISGIKALSYSYDLIKNRWLDVVILLAKIFVLMILFVMVPILLLAIIVFLLNIVSQESAVLVGLLSGLASVCLIFYATFISFRISYKIYVYLEESKTYSAKQEDFKTRKVIFIILFIIGLATFLSELSSEKNKGETYSGINIEGVYIK